LAIRNGCRTHAVESGPQRRIFQSQSAAALLPVTIDPEYHYERSMLRSQKSLLTAVVMRRVHCDAENFKAFSRGSLEFLHPEIAKFWLSSAGTKINNSGGSELSRFAQSRSSIFRASAAVSRWSLRRNLFRPIKNRATSSRGPLPTTGSPCKRDRRPPDVKKR